MKGPFMKIKKIIPVIFFVCASIFLILGISLYIQKQNQPRTAQEVLSSGAMFYTRCVDLEKTFRDFTGSEFAAQFARIPFRAVLKEVGAPEQELMLYDTLASQISSKENQDVFFKLFGREVAVAVYPMEGEAPAAVLADAASKVCVVVRLRPEVRFVELLTAALSKLSPKFSESITEYKKHKIHIITLKGAFLSVGYIRFGDLLIFGVGDAAAKRAVDVVEDKTLALAQDESFLKTQAQFLEGAQHTVFLDYALFMKRMKGVFLKMAAQSGTLDPAVRARVEKGFENANGFNVFAFSAQYGDVLRGRFDMMFDIHKMSSRIRKFYDFSPVENTSLAFLPASAFVYSWSSLAGFDLYWQEIKKEWEQKRDSRLAEVPLAGGLTVAGIEEVIGLLTDQFGWYVSGVELSDRVPVPQAVVFFGIKDAQHTREVVQRLVDEQGIFRLNTEEYQGEEIRYFENIPFVKDLQPGYCVIDQYLVLATNKSLLEEALKVRKGTEKALKARGLFAENPYGLLDRGTGILFIDNDRLVSELSRILQWADEWADVQYARYLAFKAGAEKRLDDVQKEIAETQAEMDALEKTLVDIQEAQGAGETEDLVREEYGRLEKELERKRKIAQSVIDTLQELRSEEKELVSAQKDQAQKLTDAGLERLAEVRAEIGRRKARQEEITKDIQGLQQDYEAAADRVRGMEEKEKTIQEKEQTFEDKRNDLRALQEKEKELEEVVKGYEKSDLPTPEQRETILNGAIQPALQAFKSISWIAGRSKITDGRIRSEFFLQVK